MRCGAESRWPSAQSRMINIHILLKSFVFFVLFFFSQTVSGFNIVTIAHTKKQSSEEEQDCPCTADLPCLDPNEQNAGTQCKAYFRSLDEAQATFNSAASGTYNDVSEVDRCNNALSHVNCPLQAILLAQRKAGTVPKQLLIRSRLTNYAESTTAADSGVATSSEVVNSRFTYVGCFSGETSKISTNLKAASDDQGWDPQECIEYCTTLYSATAELFANDLGTVIVAVHNKDCGCVANDWTVFVESPGACTIACPNYQNTLCGGQAGGSVVAWGVFMEYESQSYGSQGTYDPWRYVWYTVVVIKQSTVDGGTISGGGVTTVTKHPERYYLHAVNQLGKPVFQNQMRIENLLIFGLQYDLDSSRLVGLCVPGEFGRVQNSETEVEWDYKIIRIDIDESNPNNVQLSPSTVDLMDESNRPISTSEYYNVLKNSMVFSGVSGIISMDTVEVYIFTQAGGSGAETETPRGDRLFIFTIGNSLVVNSVDKGTGGRLVHTSDLGIKVLQLFANNRYGHVSVVANNYPGSVGSMVYLYMGQMSYSSSDGRLIWINQYTSGAPVENNKPPQMAVAAGRQPVEMIKDFHIYPGAGANGPKNASFITYRNYPTTISADRVEEDTSLAIVQVDMYNGAQTKWCQIECETAEDVHRSVDPSVPYAAVFNAEPGWPLTLPAPRIVEARFDIEGLKVVIVFDRPTMRGDRPVDYNGDKIPDDVVSLDKQAPRNQTYCQEQKAENPNQDCFASPTDCNEFLDAQTMAMLGSSPYCQWDLAPPKGETLTVTLNDDADLDVGSQMFLLSDTIYTKRVCPPGESAGCEYSPPAVSEGAKVAAPEPCALPQTDQTKPCPPAVVVQPIQGSFTVDSCAGIEISAADTKRKGGSASYKWSFDTSSGEKFTAPPDGRTMDMAKLGKMEKLLDLETGAVLRIASDDIPAGFTYNMQVSVTSRWNMTADSPFVVEKLDYPSPTIVAQDWTQPKPVTPGEELFIETKIVQSTCSLNEVSVSCLWDAKSTPSGSEFPPTFEPNAAGQNLRIPAYSLQAPATYNADDPTYNEYVFEVVCAVSQQGNAAVSNYIRTEVKAYVYKSQLIARLYPEDAIVNQGEYLVLNGRLTIDPDDQVSYSCLIDETKCPPPAFDGQFTFFCSRTVPKEDTPEGAILDNDNTDLANCFTQNMGTNVGQYPGYVIPGTTFTYQLATFGTQTTCSPIAGRDPIDTGYGNIQYRPAQFQQPTGDGDVAEAYCYEKSGLLIVNSSTMELGTGYLFSMEAVHSDSRIASAKATVEVTDKPVAQVSVKVKKNPGFEALPLISAYATVTIIGKINDEGTELADEVAKYSWEVEKLVSSGQSGRADNYDDATGLFDWDDDTRMDWAEDKSSLSFLSWKEDAESGGKKTSLQESTTYRVRLKVEIVLSKGEFKGETVKGQSSVRFTTAPGPPKSGTLKVSPSTFVFPDDLNPPITFELEAPDWRADSGGSGAAELFYNFGYRQLDFPEQQEGFKVASFTDTAGITTSYFQISARVIPYLGGTSEVFVTLRVCTVYQVCAFQLEKLEQSANAAATGEELREALVPDESKMNPQIAASSLATIQGLAGTNVIDDDLKKDMVLALSSMVDNMYANLDLYTGADRAAVQETQRVITAMLPDLGLAQDELLSMTTRAADNLQTSIESADCSATPELCSGGLDVLQNIISAALTADTGVNNNLGNRRMRARRLAVDLADYKKDFGEDLLSTIQHDLGINSDGEHDGSTPRDPEATRRLERLLSGEDIHGLESGETDAGRAQRISETYGRRMTDRELRARQRILMDIERFGMGLLAPEKSGDPAADAASSFMQKSLKITSLSSTATKRGERAVLRDMWRNLRSFMPQDYNEENVPEFLLTKSGQRNINQLQKRGRDLGAYGSTLKHHLPRKAFGQNHPWPKPRRILIGVKGTQLADRTEWEKARCNFCGIYELQFPKKYAQQQGGGFLPWTEYTVKDIKYLMRSRKGMPYTLTYNMTAHRYQIVDVARRKIVATAESTHGESARALSSSYAHIHKYTNTKNIFTVGDYKDSTPKILSEPETLSWSPETIEMEALDPHIYDCESDFCDITGLQCWKRSELADEFLIYRNWRDLRECCSIPNPDTLCQQPPCWFDKVCPAKAAKRKQEMKDGKRLSFAPWVRYVKGGEKRTYDRNTGKRLLKSSVDGSYFEVPSIKRDSNNLGTERGTFMDHHGVHDNWFKRWMQAEYPGLGNVSVTDPDLPFSWRERAIAYELYHENEERRLQMIMNLGGVPKVKIPRNTPKDKMNRIWFRNNYRRVQATSTDSSGTADTSANDNAEANADATSGTGSTNTGGSSGTASNTASDTASTGEGEGEGEGNNAASAGSGEAASSGSGEGEGEGNNAPADVPPAEELSDDGITGANEELEIPLLKQSRKVYIQREAATEANLRKDAKREIVYSSYSESVQMTMRESDTGAARAQYDFFMSTRKNISQILTKVTVIRDLITRKLIVTLTANQRALTFGGAEAMFKTTIGKTTNLSSSLPNKFAFPPSYAVPPDTPDNPTANNPLTAFAYQYVEYKQNIYDWSPSSPPADPTSMRMVTLVIFRANTEDLPVIAADESIRVFKDTSVYASGRCLIWNRFYPDTAGGAWDGTDAINDAQGCLVNTLGDIGFFIDGRSQEVLQLTEATTYPLEKTVDKTKLTTMATMIFILLFNWFLIFMGYRDDEKIRSDQRAGLIPYNAFHFDGDGITAPMNASDPIAYKYASLRNALFLRTFWNVIKRDHIIISPWFYSETFTRPQKWLCVMALLMGLLGFNAIIYGNPNSIQSGDQFVVSGILAALFIFPMFCGLVFMFTARPIPVKRRNIKKRAIMSELDALAREKQKLAAASMLPGTDVDVDALMKSRPTFASNVGLPVGGLRGSVPGTGQEGLLALPPPDYGDGRQSMGRQTGMLALPAPPGFEASRATMQAGPGTGLPPGARQTMGGSRATQNFMARQTAAPQDLLPPIFFQGGNEGRATMNNRATAALMDESGNNPTSTIAPGRATRQMAAAPTPPGAMLPGNPRATAAPGGKGGSPLALPSMPAPVASGNATPSGSPPPAPPGAPINAMGKGGAHTGVPLPPSNPEALNMGSNTPREGGPAPPPAPGRFTMAPPKPQGEGEHNAFNIDSFDESESAVCPIDGVEYTEDVSSQIFFQSDFGMMGMSSASVSEASCSPIGSGVSSPREAQTITSIASSRSSSSSNLVKVEEEGGLFLFEGDHSMMPWSSKVSPGGTPTSPSSQGKGGMLPPPVSPLRVAPAFEAEHGMPPPPPGMQVPRYTQAMKGKPAPPGKGGGPPRPPPMGGDFNRSASGVSGVFDMSGGPRTPTMPPPGGSRMFGSQSSFGGGDMTPTGRMSSMAPPFAGRQSSIVNRGQPPPNYPAPFRMPPPPGAGGSPMKGSGPPGMPPPMAREPTMVMGREASMRGPSGMGMPGMPPPMAREPTMVGMGREQSMRGPSGMGMPGMPPPMARFPTMVGAGRGTMTEADSMALAIPGVDVPDPRMSAMDPNARMTMMGPGAALPPPPPREDDSAFVRRVRLIYMDRVMREHQKQSLQDMDNIGRPVPTWVFNMSALMPYIAAATFIVASVIVVLIFAVKFDGWQESHWYYATLVGFCMVVFLLDVVRAAVTTIVELRKYEIRRRAKAGDFVVRKVAKPGEDDIPSMLKPKNRATQNKARATSARPSQAPRLTNAARITNLPDITGMGLEGPGSRPGSGAGTPLGRSTQKTIKALPDPRATAAPGADPRYTTAVDPRATRLPGSADPRATRMPDGGDPRSTTRQTQAPTFGQNAPGSGSNVGTPTGLQKGKSMAASLSQSLAARATSGPAGPAKGKGFERQFSGTGMSASNTGAIPPPPGKGGSVTPPGGTPRDGGMTPQGGTPRSMSGMKGKGGKSKGGMPPPPPPGGKGKGGTPSQTQGGGSPMPPGGGFGMSADVFKNA